MKKIIFLFILILTIALLGCSNNETPSKNDNDITIRNEKLLFLSETSSEFIQYLYSNPIDLAMENEEKSSKIYSTKDIDSFYSKYYNIWHDELNTVYEKLSNQLVGEAKEKLIRSQTAWEEENQYSSELWQNVFDMSKGHGSGDYSLIMKQSIDRIRARTFLLAEYYYWLTGKFEFTYNTD